MFDRFGMLLTLKKNIEIYFIETPLKCIRCNDNRHTRKMNEVIVLD